MADRVRRSWALAALVAVVLGAWPFRGGPQAAPASAPNVSFLVSRLDVVGGSISTGAWLPATEMVDKPVLRVVVMASWCSISKQMLAQMSRDDELRSQIDLVLFYEDEAERKIAQWVKKGQMTPDEADKYRSRLAEKNQMLISPEALEPYNLPYYLIKKGQFSKLMNSYPTVIECSAKGCQRLQLQTKTK